MNLEFLLGNEGWAIVSAVKDKMKMEFGRFMAGSEVPSEKIEIEFLFPPV